MMLRKSVNRTHTLSHPTSPLFRVSDEPPSLFSRDYLSRHSSPSFGTTHSHPVLPFRGEWTATERESSFGVGGGGALRRLLSRSLGASGGSGNRNGRFMNREQQLKGRIAEGKVSNPLMWTVDHGLPVVTGKTLRHLQNLNERGDEGNDRNSCDDRGDCTL